MISLDAPCIRTDPHRRAGRTCVVVCDTVRSVMGTAGAFVSVFWLYLVCALVIKSTIECTQMA
jgi:hypothetical protein